MDTNSVDPNSMPILSIAPWWKDVVLVLAGGLCALAASILTALVSIWYQVKKSRQIKMEEAIGSQKVDAYKKALRLADGLGAVLIQGTEDDVLGFIKTDNQWVLDNEILLPPKFVQNWHSVRHNTLHIKRKDQARHRMRDGSNELNETIEEIVRLGEFCRELAKEAASAVRQELGLPDFKIRHLRKPDDNTDNN